MVGNYIQQSIIMIEILGFNTSGHTVRFVQHTPDGGGAWSGEEDVVVVSLVIDMR